MNNLPNDDARRRELDRQAAAWVLKRDRGLSASEQDAFFEWLAEHPDHGARLARHEKDWRRLNVLSAWQPEHSAEPNPDLLALPLGSRLRRFVPASLIALGAAAALVAAGLYLLEMPADRTVAPTNLVAVPDGGPRMLEDGTIVELNDGAVVTVQYSESERRVSFDHGEAHFAVSKDASRPFIVTSRGIEMKALGTAFNVRIDPASAVVEVLVTEGEVQVQREALGEEDAPKYDLDPESPELPVLVARQRAIVSYTDWTEPPQIATLSVSEVERVLAWHHRLLNFTDAPLSEVVRSFNHRNVVQLVLIDAELAASRITLLSFRSDNVEGFVRLLEQGFEARAERRGETEILLHKSGPSN